MKWQNKGQIMSVKLKDILHENGLFAKKSLGQHFLLDINLTTKIANYADICDNSIVFEIGPGPGGLTQALLNSKAKKVIAIEKDERFAQHLRDYFAQYGDRLQIIEGDALQIQLHKILEELDLVDCKPKIVANLPYNVGTQMLINWLLGPEKTWDMTLMFQTEVAMRITAKTNDNHYGRLAILTYACAQAQIVMNVPRLAFTPPPKVESAVVNIRKKENPYENLKALAKVTHAAFSQRRKMLRASIGSLGNASEILEKAQIIPTLRPENLPPEGFFKIADIISED
jgi:16S rRNA (adenine1518-N6/adenine1519-N6)-dimethyltransferase